MQFKDLNGLQFISMNNLFNFLFAFIKALGGVLWNKVNPFQLINYRALICSII